MARRPRPTDHTRRLGLRRKLAILSVLIRIGRLVSSSTTKRTKDMTFLSGYRTYIVAAAMAIFAIAGLLGIDIPSFEGQAPGNLLMEALAIFFLRQGVKSGPGGV